MEQENYMKRIGIPDKKEYFGDRKLKNGELTLYSGENELSK